MLNIVFEVGLNVEPHRQSCRFSLPAHLTVRAIFVTEIKFIEIELRTVWTEWMILDFQLWIQYNMIMFLLPWMYNTNSKCGQNCRLGTRVRLESRFYTTRDSQLWLGLGTRYFVSWTLRFRVRLRTLVLWRQTCYHYNYFRRVSMAAAPHLIILLLSIEPKFLAQCFV